MSVASRSAGDVARVKLEHASASKFDRAQPVLQRYGMGLVRHRGVFRELQDEMCCFGADEAGSSPERVDALVWAIDPRKDATPTGAA
jgi:phage terminase large subunit-like protein